MFDEKLLSGAQRGEIAPSGIQHGFLKMKLPTIKQVICHTANHFKMPEEVLTSKDTKSQKATLRRQIGMHIARELTFKSLKQVAIAFGRSDPASVRFAANKIIKLAEQDAAVAADVETIIKAINQEENENVGTKLPDTSRT